MGKKVVLLIVEGGSDKIAIEYSINEYLRSLGLGKKLVCSVYSTDITIHPYGNGNIFADSLDVMKRVEKTVERFLSEQGRSERLKLTDIVAIATLSDLDACYCLDSDVIHQEEKQIKYDVINRKIFTNDIPFIVERNHKKQDAFAILKTETFVKKKPFRAYYFGINMEHFLYGFNEHHSKEEKDSFARRFHECCKKKPELVKFFFERFTVSIDYCDSWDEKRLKKDVFERSSNVKHLLDWIINQI